MQYIFISVASKTIYYLLWTIWDDRMISTETEKQKQKCPVTEHPDSHLCCKEVSYLYETCTD